MSSAATTIENIQQANLGFDCLFASDIEGAKAHLSKGDSPFHLMGHGAVVFLQAALGMEAGVMTEANRLLALAEAGAKKELKAANAASQTHNRRFPPGLEFEVLQADAVLLLGLTQALSESYTGYLQCMYSLNNAHSQFTRIYKTAFPDGLNSFATPYDTPIPTPNASTLDVTEPNPASSSQAKNKGGLFGFLGLSGNKVYVAPANAEPDGPIEEFIVAGTALGFGLFTLIFSLLPKKITGLVGWLGFQSDRKLALRALSFATTKDDSHAVFAGLALMSYHNAVLSLSGWQADQRHIMRQYQGIVDKLMPKYPAGSLWTLHRAKLMAYRGDSRAAIEALESAMSPDRATVFVQADALLIFDLAWSLLEQRRYKESAERFIQLTELNSWSHATYYYIAAGCYISLGDLHKSRELFDQIPALLEKDKKKIGGRELPMETFIRKRIAFYRQKHKRRGGAEDDFVESIKLNPAEETGLFWNVHSKGSQDATEERIREWLQLSPPVKIKTPYMVELKQSENTTPDLDSADELAMRSLLLGITHRTLSRYAESRAFFEDASSATGLESKWIAAVALFETAVLVLIEADKSEKNSEASSSPEQLNTHWKATYEEANALLDKASEASTSSTDMSSRLDSRIVMLKDEMKTRREMMGF